MATGMRRGDFVRQNTAILFIKEEKRI